MFVLSLLFFISFLLFNLSFSCLFSLYCLFRFIVCLHYCLILQGDCSAFISFHLIVLFIPLLHSSINGLSLYPLLFATLLNSIQTLLSSYFSIPTFFNSTTFVNLLSLLPNSFFSLVRNSPTLLSPNPPKHSLFKCSLILPIHMSEPVTTLSLSSGCN